MAVLMECPNPLCRRKQGLLDEQGRQRKICINEDCKMPLEKERKNGKVRYWITYRLQGKQIWELVGPNPYSTKDAQGCEAKRRGQRREKKLTILDIKEPSPVTFDELAEHFLGQDFIKENRSYKTIGLRLKPFREVFGPKEIGTITNSDIKNYQAKRCKEVAYSTVDQE